MDSKSAPSAKVCFDTAVRALQLVAAELPPTHGVEVWPTGPHIARVSFEASLERLKAQGAIITTDRDLSWLRFAELRKEYEGSLFSMAGSLLVPVRDTLLLPLSSPEAVARG